MPKITDKSFVYVPSFSTDIGARFKRMRAQQARERKAETARAEAERVAKVQPIKRSGK